MRGAAMCLALVGVVCGVGGWWLGGGMWPLISAGWALGAFVMEMGQ